MKKTASLSLPNFRAKFASAFFDAGYSAGRHSKNYSAFAKLAGIDTTSVGHYLAGRYKPTLPTLQRIADALNVDLEFFGVDPNNIQASMKVQKKIPTRRYKKKIKSMVKSEAHSENQEIGDWRLVELATNQIAKVKLIHLDKETNILIMQMEEESNV